MVKGALNFIWTFSKISSHSHLEYQVYIQVWNILKVKSSFYQIAKFNFSKYEVLIQLAKELANENKDNIYDEYSKPNSLPGLHDGWFSKAHSDQLDHMPSSENTCSNDFYFQV